MVGDTENKRTGRWQTWVSSRACGVVFLPQAGLSASAMVPKPPCGPGCLPQGLGESAGSYAAPLGPVGRRAGGAELGAAAPTMLAPPAATPILLRPHWEGRSGICVPIFTAMEVIRVERKSIRCVHLCGTKEERSADRNRPGFTRRRLNKTFPQFEEDGNLDLPLNVSFFVPQ